MKRRKLKMPSTTNDQQLIADIGNIKNSNENYKTVASAKFNINGCNCF